MIKKAIGASTHLDAHNQKLTKEDLEKIKDDIKNGKYAGAIKIEHDLTVMPIGKVIDADIIKLEDGEYALFIIQEIFDETFGECKNETGETWFIQKSIYDNRPFLEDIEDEKIKNIQIRIDQCNFKKEDYQKLINLYINEYNLEAGYIMRKSLIPDPEIVIAFAAGTFLSKLVEKMTDDLSKIYDLIKKVVMNTVKYVINKERPITYVLIEKNEYILEFIVITKEPNILFEALNILFTNNIREKIDNFLIFFSNDDIGIKDISKIQFLYDIKLKQWQLHYVNTITGISIGSEKCYKHTQNCILNMSEKMKQKIK